MDPNLVEIGIPTSTLLAMAAMFLGLAVIVQVLQEIYKYFFNSKATAYRMVLTDFFGSWVDQLYEPGPVARFHVRGPFQWFKSQPTGVLLPLSKEDLLQALDELPTGWMGETLKVLKESVRLGGDADTVGPAPVNELIAKLRAEATAGGAGPGSTDAMRMLDFLEPVSAALATGGAMPPASVLLERFYQRFFPDRIRAEQEFDRLKGNFDHVNERRNLRYSFLFALVIAVGLNFPFDAIYRRAQALTPEEAIQLAEDVKKIHDDMEAPPDAETPDPGDETVPARTVGSPGDDDQGAGEEADTIPEEGFETTTDASEPSTEAGRPNEPTETEEELMSREELDRRLRKVEALAVRIDPSGVCADGPIWSRGWRRMREIRAGTAMRRAACVATQESSETTAETGGQNAGNDGSGLRPETPKGSGAEEPVEVKVPVPRPHGWKGIFAYLVNCLITALLVSFGAPFWDRVTDSLLARAKKEKQLARPEVSP